MSKREKAYSPEDLISAVSDVNEGKLDVAAAATLYNIPRTTLRNNLEQIRKEGRPRYLTEEEEEELVDCVVTLANWGFGLSNENVKDIIKNHQKLDNRNYKGFAGLNLFNLNLIFILFL